jgi:hypothetical protein
VKTVPGKAYFIQWNGDSCDFSWPGVLGAQGKTTLLASNPKPTKKAVPIEQSSLPMVIFVYGVDLKLGNKLVSAGSTLKAVTADGTLCGEAKFDADGIVSMSINGDDINTSAVEGAHPGECVTLVLNGQILAQNVIWTKFGDVKELKALTTTGVEYQKSLPKEFALHQNYPNPFNPTTEIRYDLPKNAFVQLKIYNSLGQLVRTLVNQDKPAGTYSVVWNGRSDNGSSLSSGVYITRMVAGSYVHSQKMTLLK